MMNPNYIKHILWRNVVPFLAAAFFSSIFLQACGQQRPKSIDSNLATWTKLPTNKPSMHVEGAMVYDQFHKKIIVYGGRTGFPDFNNVNETWAFDYNSKTWTNLNPKKSPPWRSSHSMVYNTSSHKILLFGGNDFTQAYNDFWEYNYKQNRWTKRSTTNAPEARQMHGMVYIPNKDVIIMFGGRRANGGASFADTWEFNCKTSHWKKLNPNKSPPVSDHINIIYDQSVHNVILFSDSQTWAFDIEIENWIQLSILNAPDSNHSNLVYSEHHKKSILFGNSNSSSGMFTWIFDYSKSSWTNITSRDFPEIDYYEHDLIEHAAMVYLNDLAVFIQYGGCCSDQTLELNLGD